MFWCPPGPQSSHPLSREDTALRLGWGASAQGGPAPAAAVHAALPPPNNGSVGGGPGSSLTYSSQLAVEEGKHSGSSQSPSCRGRAMNKSLGSKARLPERQRPRLGIVGIVQDGKKLQDGHPPREVCLVQPTLGLLLGLHTYKKDEAGALVELHGIGVGELQHGFGVPRELPAVLIIQHLHAPLPRDHFPLWVQHNEGGDACEGESSLESPEVLGQNPGSATDQPWDSLGSARNLSKKPGNSLHPLASVSSTAMW